MYARFNNALHLWEAGYVTMSRFSGRPLFHTRYIADSLRGLKAQVRRGYSKAPPRGDDWF